MLSANDSLRRLLLLYALWSAAIVFSGSLLYLYFKNAGLSELDLIASFLFWPVAPVLLILFLNKSKKTDFRGYMATAMVLQFIAFFVLFLFEPVKELLFFNTFLVGLTCFFFWVPFNIMYFELSKEMAATMSSIYFSLASLLGLIIPVASGVIAETLGFRILFLISAILFLLLLAAVRFVEKREYKYDFIDSTKETKGFKTLIVLEGVYGGGISAATTIITLMYFETPIELGVFLSMTTLFSVIASFIISKISDKAQKRKRYIVPSALGLGIATSLAGLATSAVAWFIAISARNFFATLFYPFTTTIMVDNKRNMSKLMVGREWLLNIGRIFGISIVLFCSAVFSTIHLSLVFLGFLILIYPLVIELKKRHISVA